MSRGESVTTREYFDAVLVGHSQRVADLDRRVTELDTIRAEAVRTARAAIEDKLAGMNEFRGSLNDMANRAATRAEVETYQTAVRAQIDANRNSSDSGIAAMRDKVNDVKVQVAVVAALVSLLTAAVTSGIVAMLSKWIGK